MRALVRAAAALAVLVAVPLDVAFAQSPDDPEAVESPGAEVTPGSPADESPPANLAEAAKMDAAGGSFVFPQVRGHATTGAALLDSELRRILADGKHSMVDPAAFAEAAIDLGVVGKSDPAALAEVGRKVGAKFVLDVHVTRLGWLYTARALMIDASSGQIVMDFKSGFYQPKTDPPDRAQRIARVTNEKLDGLVAGGGLVATGQPIRPTPTGTTPTGTTPGGTTRDGGTPAATLPAATPSAVVSDTGGEPSLDELLRRDIQKLRIVIPDASGGPSSGAKQLTRRLRQDMRRSLGTLIEPDALGEAQRELNIRGRAAFKPSNLVRAAQKVGAHYVLRVEVDKSGWLYQADATLLNVETGDEQMAFRVGYYKPGTEAADRGRRIARTTIGKLVRLIQAGKSPIASDFRASAKASGAPIDEEVPIADSDTGKAASGEVGYFVEDEGEGDTGGVYVEEADGDEGGGGDFVPSASATLETDDGKFDPLNPGGSVKDWLPKALHDALTFRFRFTTYGYKEKTTTDRRLFRIEDYFEMHYDQSYAAWIRAYFGLRFQIDDHANRFADDFDAWKKLQDEGYRRSYLSPKEYYLHFSFWELELRAGKQFHGFGKADLFSPTSLVNPWDFMDVLEAEPIAVPSASLEYFPFSFLDAKLIFVPFFTPGRVPLTGNRWTFFSPDAIPPGLAFDERELPDSDPKNFQYAVRVNATFVGTDVSFYWFDGLQSLPNTIVSVSGNDPMNPRVSLVPVYDHIQMAGGDFSTTLGGFELHGEIAHIWTDENRGPDYLQWVIGTRYLTSGIGGGDNQFIATLEYTQDDNTTDARAELRNDLPASIDAMTQGAVIDAVATQLNTGGEDTSSRNRPFPRAIMTRFSFDLGARWSFSNLFQFVLDKDFKYSGFLEEPEIAFKATDTLKVQLKAQIIGGKSTGFYGQYTDNDRLILRLNYVF